jgi:hypothetical protein
MTPAAPRVRTSSWRIDFLTAGVILGSLRASLGLCASPKISGRINSRWAPSPAIDKTQYGTWKREQFASASLHDFATDAGLVQSWREYFQFYGFHQFRQISDCVQQ